MQLAALRALLVAPVGIGADHAAPEGDGLRVTQVFHDVPATGEAIEDQPHGLLAHAAAAPGRATKNSAIEYSAAPRPAAPGPVRTIAKPTGRSSLSTRQQVGAGIGKPAGQLVGLAVADFGQRRKQTGAERRQVIEVIAIDRFDPGAVAARLACVADADRHARNHAAKHESPCRPGYGLRGLSCQTRLDQFFAGAAGAAGAAAAGGQQRRQPEQRQEQRHQQPERRQEQRHRQPERRPEQRVPGCCKQPARTLRQQRQERA